MRNCRIGTLRTVPAAVGAATLRHRRIQARGLDGGVPATGAIARTAVNVRTGAGSRLAALIHAAILAVIVFAAAPLVSRIPPAALAGVLPATAIRIGALTLLRFKDREYATTPEAIQDARAHLERTGVLPAVPAQQNRAPGEAPVR